jgi:hypothetical protein
MFARATAKKISELAQAVYENPTKALSGRPACCAAAIRTAWRSVYRALFKRAFSRWAGIA